MNAYPTIADTADRVGESPVWDVRAQRLWWVDIEGAFIRCTEPGTSAPVQSWRMPERVACIALTSCNVTRAMPVSMAAISWP